MASRTKRLIDLPSRDKLLHRAATVALIDALVQIDNNIRHYRNKALGNVDVTEKDSGHITTELDQRIEADTEARLRTLLYPHGSPDDLNFLGEESLKEDVDLSGCNQVVVLVDMIDGTDLLARELGNWCCAMTFFAPSKGAIISSYVGMSFGDYFRIYAAFGDGKGQPSAWSYFLPIERPWGAHRRPIFNEYVRTPLKSTPAEHDLSNVQLGSVGFYEQKLARLSQVLAGTGLLKNDQLMAAKKFRIYTLAGNPMLAKVADGTITAVFETIGQHPHDVVPGAFICKVAGCKVTDLNGNLLDLDRPLLHPASKDSKMTYLISRSDSLHSVLLPILKQSPMI